VSAEVSRAVDINGKALIVDPISCDQTTLAFMVNRIAIVAIGYASNKCARLNIDVFIDLMTPMVFKSGRFTLLSFSFFHDFDKSYGEIRIKLRARAALNFQQCFL
jgi:hypothetical protein